MEEDEIMDDSEVNMVTNDTQEDSEVLTVINRRCPTFHVNVNGNQEELIDTMVNNLPSLAIIKDIAHQNFLKTPKQTAIQGMPATRTLQNGGNFFGSPLSESPVEYNTDNDNRLSQLSLIQPSPHLATKNSQVLNQVSMNVLNIAINHMIQQPYPKLPLRMVVSQPAQRYPAIEDKKVMLQCGNSASDSEPLSQTIIDLFNKPIMFKTVADICKPVELTMRRKASGENSFHNSSLEQYSSLYGKKENNDRSLVSVADKKVYLTENPFTPPNWLLNKFLASQPDSSLPDLTTNQPNADDPVKDDFESQGSQQANKMECLVFQKEQTSQLENGNTDTFLTENRKDNESEEFEFKPDLEPQVYFNFRDEQYVNKEELPSKKRKYVTSEDFITVPKNCMKRQCLEIDYIQTNVEEETELSCIGSSFSDQSLSLDLSMERLRQTFEDSEDESMDI